MERAGPTVRPPMIPPQKRDEPLPAIRNYRFKVTIQFGQRGKPGWTVLEYETRDTDARNVASRYQACFPAGTITSIRQMKR